MWSDEYIFLSLVENKANQYNSSAFIGIYWIYVSEMNTMISPWNVFFNGILECLL